MGAAVTLNGIDVTVGADLGTTRGSNLFHSFERFGVRSGGSVTFTGPDGLDNVIGRVTGGDASTIDGLLRSRVPGADLWLINPAGILFGSGARLDVPGSFHASTAGNLRFADGAIFSALDLGGSTFSVATPESFGFVGGDGGAIRVDRSRLSVRAGQTLALIGGDITVTAGGNGAASFRGGRNLKDALATGPAGSTDIRAGARRVVSGGRNVFEGGTPVTVNGVPVIDGVVHVSDGRVILVAQGGTGLVDIGGESLDAPATGRLTIERQALISATGPQGEIRLRGGEIAIIGRSLVATLNGGSTDAIGSLSIEGRDLRISESVVASETYGSGSSAEVRIRVNGDIDLERGGSIVSHTRIDGRSGDLLVEAGRISMSPLVEESIAGNSAITSIVKGFASGDAGTVRVRAGSIEIRDGGVIQSSTFGNGNAGLVDIDVEGRFFMQAPPNDREQFTGVSASALPDRTGDTGFTGSAGAIEIDAGELVVENAARIRAVTQTAGAGGSITIRAGDLTLEQQDPPRRFGAAVIESNSGTETAGGARRRGNAGPIVIDVDRDIRLIGKAIIRSESRGEGTGDAGSVTIRAQRMFIDTATVDENLQGETGVSTVVFSPGRQGLPEGAAGIIDIDVGELDMNGGIIRSSTGGNGDAGQVTITADRLSLQRNPDGSIQEEGEVDRSQGLISSSSFGKSGFVTSGNAGSVTLRVGDLRVGDGAFVSSIATSEGSLDNTGDAGDIVIAAERVLVEGSGRIRAVTQTRGRGGSVSIQATQLTLRQEAPPERFGAAVIEANSGLDTGVGSSRRGDAGSVTIDVTGEVAILGKAIIRSESRGQGPGDAGDVTINAGSLVIDTLSVDRFLQDETGVSSVVFSPGDQNLSTGSGGDVVVDVGRLTMNGGLIRAQTGGDGDGGSVRINAGSLSVRGNPAGTIPTNGGADRTRGEISSSSFGKRGFQARGNAGEVRIEAGRIFVGERGTINSSTLSRGDAGDVILNGRRIEIVNGSVRTSVDLATNSTTGEAPAGGRITISSQGLVQLEGAEITTNGLALSDNASIIDLDAAFVLIRDGSVVQSCVPDCDSVTTAGVGNTAIATVNGRVATFVSPDSTVQASNEVTIQGIESEIGSDLQVPEGAFISNDELLGESCAARSAGASSSFVSVGRGGLPPSPERPLAARGVAAVGIASSDIVAGGLGSCDDEPGKGTVSQ